MRHRRMVGGGQSCPFPHFLYCAYSMFCVYVLYFLYCMYSLYFAYLSTASIFPNSCLFSRVAHFSVRLRMRNSPNSAHASTPPVIFIYSLSFLLLFFFRLSPLFLLGYSLTPFFVRFLSFSFLPYLPSVRNALSRAKEAGKA